MDEAARQTGIDRIALRRRNFIRPEQMPYTNPMGAGLRQRPVREGDGPARWRWPTGPASRRAPPNRRSAASSAAWASPPSWNGPAASVLEERVTVTVMADGVIEVFSAVNAMGQGIADLARAAGGRRLRRADRARCAWCWATPIAATASAAPARVRSSPAARPCASASERTIDHARGLAAQGAGGGGRRRDLRRRAVHRRRHRPRDRPVRPRRHASREQPHLHGFDQHRVRPELAQRLPHQRSRGRPADRRRRGGGLCVDERRRPRGEPDDRARPARRRRGAGHRPGAAASRSSTTPKPASSSPAASWTTRCRIAVSSPRFQDRRWTSPRRA